MVKQITLKLEWGRILPILLALVIGLSIGLWQPWASSSGRTISVTGEATLEATPDEFTFYPQYFNTADSLEKAKANVVEVGQKVLEKIKEFGVPENKITLDIGSYEQYDYLENQVDEYQAYYNLTIVVDNKEIAQNIQNYLLTTETASSVTPNYSFSESKRSELKAEARKQAVNHAKNQAEQIATELGDRLGKVNQIEEVTGFDYLYPLYSGRDIASTSESTFPSTTVLSGEQKLTFTVKVVYAVK